MRLDGLSEEIINTLSKMAALRVAARASAFAFKGKDVGIREIGADLRVGTVLEGSVRKAGDRLRITAQLIRVADGFHLWFAIQANIARSIGKALQVQLASEPERAPVTPPTQNLRAYELYLQGRRSLNLRTEDGLRSAIGMFTEAIRLEPEYAQAHAGLADSYTLLWHYRYDSSVETRAAAKATARRALAIDPNLAETHASLGKVLQLEGSWRRSHQELQRAIELNPSYPSAHHWLSDLLLVLGRIDEAQAEIERAVDLDPLSPIINRIAGSLAYLAGDYDTAMGYFWKSLDLNPQEPGAPLLLARLYLAKGMEAETAEIYLLLQPPLARPFMRIAFRFFGLRRLFAMRSAVATLVTGDPCPGPFSTTAVAWAYFGEPERMFTCLERADPFDFGMVKEHPDIVPYHADPRFVAILHRSGLDP